MKFDVNVVARGAGSLPADGQVRVEVRDVTVLDAPSVSVAAVETDLLVGERGGRTDGLQVASVELEVPDHVLTAGRDLVVWARVGHGTAQTAPGDWITMQSVPIPSATTPASAINVDVRRID